MNKIINLTLSAISKTGILIYEVFGPRFILLALLYLVGVGVGGAIVIDASPVGTPVIFTQNHSWFFAISLVMFVWMFSLFMTADHVINESIKEEPDKTA